MSDLTAVLSQYELLLTVCQHLSSADIVHLAATCKAHFTYIASSKPTFDLLKSNAVCDGKGIDARIKVFGYPEDDPSISEAPCLGVDAKPCTLCGAKVCNNCRFHFAYDSSMTDEKTEAIFAGNVEGIGIDHIPFSFSSSLASIEAKRAFDVFWGLNRTRRYCEDCHPLMVPRKNYFQNCLCKFFEFFVGSRWLCLPCFFVEEAKVHRDRMQRVYAHETGFCAMIHKPIDKPGYPTEFLCSCGKPAMQKTTEFCRFCGLAKGWYRDMEGFFLEKILAQLG